MQIDIKNFNGKKIFFSGIGGVSMSSLAIVLKNNNYQVSGSDRNSSKITDLLIENGITDIKFEQTAENIKNIDLLVRTAAISNDNPEIVKAKELNIPIMERSTLLGQIMREYDERINVSGTHGKTTTTAMMSLVLMYAGLKPTVMVGGDFDKIGGNFLSGNKDYFVCEACEYVESFLEFYPTSSIILNVEEDHLDYYKDIEHIKSAFKKFALKTEKIVMANSDDENIIDLTKDFSSKIIYFGINNGKYRAKNIVYNKSTTEYDLYAENVFLAKITLKVAGKHSVLNSLAVAGLSNELGIDISHVKTALFDFTGAKRRMEFICESNGITIYDDYAHHPTEILTTISSLRQKNPTRIVALFQPHTYTRTKALKADFIKALSSIDKLYICDIYAAREKNPGDVHSKDLVEMLPNAEYVGDVEAAAKAIEKELKSGDYFVTIGAGDVYKAGLVVKEDFLTYETV